MILRHVPKTGYGSDGHREQTVDRIENQRFEPGSGSDENEREYKNRL